MAPETQTKDTDNSGPLTQESLRNQLKFATNYMRYLEAKVEAQREACNRISRRIEWTAEEIMEREG